jgi:hypothetical protein
MCVEATNHRTRKEREAQKVLGRTGNCNQIVPVHARRVLPEIECFSRKTEL